MRFLVPARTAKALSPLEWQVEWQGPSPLPHRHAGTQSSRGPKAPGQRPPRHRRALACGAPGPAGLRRTAPPRAGKRGACPVSALPGAVGRAKAAVALRRQVWPPAEASRKGCCDPPLRAARRKAGSQMPGHQGLFRRTRRPGGYARRCAASTRPASAAPAPAGPAPDHRCARQGSAGPSFRSPVSWPSPAAPGPASIPSARR